MNEAVQKTMRHPIWSVGAVVAVIALFFGGLGKANDVENKTIVNAGESKRIEQIHNADIGHIKETLDGIKTLLSDLNRKIQ